MDTDLICYLQRDLPYTGFRFMYKLESSRVKAECGNYCWTSL